MSVERAEKQPVMERPPARWIIIAVIGILILIGGVLAIPRLFSRAQTPSVPADQASQVKTVPVGQPGKVGDLVITAEAMQLAEIKIGPAVVRQVSEKLTVSGNVEAGGDRLVKITPRVRGKVVRLNAVVGDAVREGQILGLIESSELARAQADYRQASARVEVARLNLERQRKLAQLGTFGQPRLEDARRAAVTAEMESNTLENDIASARAKVAEAQSDLRAILAALSQAQTQLKVLESRMSRASLLLKEQLISRQEWEQTQADCERARADVEAARAKVAQGEARIETEKADLKAVQARLEAARKRSAIEKKAADREEQVYRGRFITSKEMV